VPRTEALLRARREFGSRLKTAEDTSGAWQMQWLEDLASDLRYAGRAFRRNPGFALTAIFCLALGIGANTTIFNITTGFLFSQPSCRDNASLIAIWEGGNSGASLADFQFLRDAQVFAGMAGINPWREVNWRDGDRTSRFYAGMVTDDFFGTLGVPFLLGRGIAPGDTNTAVLSNRFGAAPSPRIRQSWATNCSWRDAPIRSPVCFQQITVRSLGSASHRIFTFQSRMMTITCNSTRACRKA
jgi:putative ABC transport system permease protein